MRFKAILAALAFGAIALYGQATQNTTIQPDIFIPFTLNAAGSFPATPVANGPGDNRQRGAAAWTMIYQCSGFTMVSMQVDSGASVSTTVTFGAFAGTVTSGFTNPIVSNTGGTTILTNGTAAISWVRVTLSASGSGTCNGVLYGFRNSAAAVNSGTSGTVTAITQACGITNTPNPITTTGTVLSNGVCVTIANAGVTGTTVNKLAKLTGAPSTAVISGAGDTGGAIGIVDSGAGTTGSAVIKTDGEHSCVFDEATVAGHYVQISASVAGDCTDAGATFPTSGQVIGQVLSTNVGAGTYTVDMSLGQASTSSTSSVFTGSTATAPVFSATPTFSLADVSVKSPVRVEPGTLTANVTSVTFTNKTAGAKFSIAWTQDGTGGRTVAYGGSASNTCVAIDPTPSATTTQSFEVGSDGSTVYGTGCTTTSTLYGTNAQTSTYQVLASDFLLSKTIIVASGTFTITLVATAAQPGAGQSIKVINYGSGVVTIARSGQNINGGTTSLVLPASSAINPTESFVISNGTDYFSSLSGVIPATTCSGGGRVSAVSTGAVGTCTPSSFFCASPGLGDGLNAIAAGTYLQTNCYNGTGATVTITGIKCFTDNSGTSTLAATNGAGTALLTGAVTCTSSFASGTQSGTTTIANADFIKFTFVADGTSKQGSWVVTGTY